MTITNGYVKNWQDIYSWGKIKAALARHPVVHSVDTDFLATGTLNLQRARTQPSVSAPSLKS